MAGITGLLTRINKCQKEFWFLNRPMAVSTVNMNADGEIMWEREVTYNPNGVLVVPLSMSIDEWEQQS